MGTWHAGIAVRYADQYRRAHRLEAHPLLRRWSCGPHDVSARGQVSILRPDPRVVTADHIDLDAVSAGVAEPGAADLRRHQEPVSGVADRADHQLSARNDAVGFHLRS